MMKPKDVAILAALRQDGRQKLTQMSKQVNLPISTLYDRLKTHEKNFIQKHASLLNFDALGFQTRAHVLFKVHKEEKEQFMETLQRAPFINSIYKINNGFDFLTECIFRNIHELESFLENLEGKHRIKSKEVYYIIQDVTREQFLADPITAPIVFGG
ncbi:Lrp/AsnC family transcriptional regulator [Candidatus Woesearchaeota archaeon]|nr:Lrp/AsnC family transcriptional regulator [Candidatus Woesearchaeota archaeon]